LESLRAEVHRLEAIAKKARSKGLATRDVEIKPAEDVAGRVEGLVGPPGIAKRIRELAKNHSTQMVAFKIAEEIVQQAGGEDPEVAADQAIRTALAILTEGITAGPLEGIAEVKIKTNTDGTPYLAVYFAGPIRAAGGTEAAETVVIADHVRRLLGLDQFKPSKAVIERYVEEVSLYNRLSHLQYPSSPEEVRMAVLNLPIEVTGEPTSEAEVSGHRDLPGVETNRLRGGAILVLNDSILGKAHKLSKLVKDLNLPGWEWLGHLSSRTENVAQEHMISRKEKYLEDIIAGRPVLAYPSRKGGFRVRYGRSRNTGLAALGVHPATMVMLDNFVACGTQLIIERPGKAGVAMPVDSIHGPVVKLRSGSIRRIDDAREAKKLLREVDRLLFLGDLLIAFGEFRENNHLLIPSGYCPEWWAQEVERALRFTPPSKKKELYRYIPHNLLHTILEDPFHRYPSPSQALAISSLLSVPLHPRYTYFWEEITVSQLRLLQQWLRSVSVIREDDYILELRGERKREIENILEELCVPCEVEGSLIIFSEAAPILYHMFLGEQSISIPDEEDGSTPALTFLQKRWPIKLRFKGTFYVGARVGRPEKAKRREMSPPIHGLFPIGRAGGQTRNILAAEKKNLIPVEISRRLCPKCGEIGTTLTCQACGETTISVTWCPSCKRISKSSICERCGGATSPYGLVDLELPKLLSRVRLRLGGRMPACVKGVKGLVSKNKIPELLEKAVLRARHNLYVYKDGTIRFDMTDAPLTHFKPREVGVPPSRLRELGYHIDIDGNPLKSDEQILELKTQDIIIPIECADYLLRVSHFLDDLLEQVYGMEPYYRLKSRDDLVGHLVVGLAPHTSAGVIGRIVGFTRLRVCYAHPFWHAAKRRNCDGDEDTVMLALDPLINFSREYLPSTRGGTMDAPLVLSITITPSEIDDEAHNMEINARYPLEFYERTLEFSDPKDVEAILDLVEHRIGTPAESLGFRYSHPTSDIEYGPRVTTYTTLKTMQEKVKRQLALERRITAVDVKDMVRRLLESHFLPDIFGNLRAFSGQKFRCTKCNTKLRRIPLTGVCPVCGGNLILTVTKGGIIKYIDMAAKIAQEYQLEPYYLQRIELARETINSLFSSAPSEQQATLRRFVNQ